MTIKELQAQLEALAVYQEEANKLTDNMQKIAESIKDDSEENIKRMKRVIEKDLNELYDYYTKAFGNKEGDYQICNKSNSPAHCHIVFERNIYEMNMTGVLKKKIAITCTRQYTAYCPIYFDGLWADEIRGDRDDTRIIQHLCSHWNEILPSIYTILAKDKEISIKNQIQNTLDDVIKAKEFNAQVRKEIPDD